MHIFDNMKQNWRIDFKNEATESIWIERFPEKIRVIYPYVQIAMTLTNYLSYFLRNLTPLQIYQMHPTKIFPKINSNIGESHGLHQEIKNLCPLKYHYFSSFTKLKDPT